MECQSQPKAQRQAQVGQRPTKTAQQGRRGKHHQEKRHKDPPAATQPEPVGRAQRRIERSTERHPQRPQNPAGAKTKKKRRNDKQARPEIMNHHHARQRAEGQRQTSEPIIDMRRLRALPGIGQVQQQGASHSNLEHPVGRPLHQPCHAKARCAQIEKEKPRGGYHASHAP